jgi:hypothetical protein
MLPYWQFARTTASQRRAGPSGGIIAGIEPFSLRDIDRNVSAAGLRVEGAFARSSPVSA